MTVTMRIGVSVFYWPWFAVEEQLSLARQADRLGFDSVWAGEHIVLPDPRLIVGSWRRRWNSSLPDGDPLNVDDDAWQVTHRALQLAAFDLRTERRDSGRGRDRTGFTGSVTLRLARGTSAVASGVFGTLARFAEYCGTGAQTTHGFGATMVSAARGSSDG